MAIAPTQLGGAVTYVIVDGNSMEPRFRLGDLVLVRTESAYGVGDAVVYRNEEMGSFVFHRIVGTDLSRFILKGDNNSWLDSYHPIQEEIIGKLWVQIPKLGNAIEWVRLPIHMALAVALLGGVLMSGMILKPNKNEREGGRPPKGFGGMQEGGLYALAILTLVFLGLTIFSFTRPLTRSQANIPYRQEGDFYYSATGTPGVYDAELVRSGEPVFPKLTCFLNIGFTYSLKAEQLQAVSGTQQLYALVKDDQSGWQRTIPMNPQTGFGGNSYSSAAALDLCEVESLVNLVEQETGLQPNTYTLEVVADIAFSGVMAGSLVNDTFAPSLVFKFDKVYFYLASDDAQAASLRSFKEGLAGSAEIQANTFSILGFPVSVRSARVTALLGFGFSLIGLFWLGIHFYRAAQQSQDALVRLKYGGMLVDVYEQNLAPTASTIDLTSIDSLAKLAERHGTMILHMQRNFLHYYVVQANGITYRYVISAGKKGSIETEAVEKEIIKTDATPPRNDLIQVRPEPLRKEPSRKKVLPNKSAEPSANPDPETVWRNIQSEALNYLKNHEEVKTLEANPTQYESPDYVIQSGEIGFYLAEPAETVLIRKIKI